MSCTTQGIMRVRKTKSAKAKPLEMTDKRMDPRQNRKVRQVPVDTGLIEWSGQE